MALRLWRDKGALWLAFILPGFMFAIFAIIFSNTTQGELDIKVALIRLDDSPTTYAMAQKLQNQDEFHLTYESDWDQKTLIKKVRQGEISVGIALADSVSNLATSPIILIKDPGRELAATLVKAHIGVQLQNNGKPTNNLFTEISTNKNPHLTPTDSSVIYYIGATAILFLLFSAMQGATITLDEREDGISERLLISAYDTFLILSGKFVFLTFNAALQALIIVVIAGLFFAISIMEYWREMLLCCTGAGVLAAGIGLLTASLVHSRAQMHNASTFIVLLFSALGGSMIPRFMMPEWLQTIALFTPNHWVIEVFYGSLARQQSLTDLAFAWSVLFGGGLLCLCLSALIAHYVKPV